MKNLFFLILAFALIFFTSCNPGNEKLLGRWIGTCMGKTDTLVISKTDTASVYELSINGVKRNGKLSGGKLFVPIVDTFLELSYDNATNKLVLKEFATVCYFDKK